MTTNKSRGNEQKNFFFGGGPQQSMNMETLRSLKPSGTLAQ